ncbi:hypothetical protein [Roseateles sp. BYS96W]|uniref:Uncharacterized protein n=1 Tax=Pelomonas nitida TaxID=3299027 RepID=A0ABW7G5Q9_9BURK
MAHTDDFDPSRVLDGWRAPAPAPVELDLVLTAGRATLDGAKKARLQARGYAMQDVQDIELPPVEPLPPFSDLPRGTLPGPRASRPAQLLQGWQPRAWTAQARRVRGASTEVVPSQHGPLVENHAPQWLCALWPPQRLDAPMLGRWPEVAALVSAETLTGALQQLLAPLPPEALVWSAELEADWALIAELVLHQDARLRPAQAQALRELVAAERSAAFARVNDGYTFDSTVARRRR